MQLATLKCLLEANCWYRACLSPGLPTTNYCLFTGLQISGHSDDEVVLGESVTITCSFDLESTSIEWVYGEEVVMMTTGSQLNLTFSPVNDTINNRVYTCRALTPYGMQEESITIEVQGNNSGISLPNRLPEAGDLRVLV